MTCRSFDGIRCDISVFSPPTINNDDPPFIDPPHPTVPLSSEIESIYNADLLISKADLQSAAADPPVTDDDVPVTDDDPPAADDPTSCADDPVKIDDIRDYDDAADWRKKTDPYKLVDTYTAEKYQKGSYLRTGSRSTTAFLIYPLVAMVFLSFVVIFKNVVTRSTIKSLRQRQRYVRSRTQTPFWKSRVDCARSRPNYRSNSRGSIWS